MRWLTGLGLACLALIAAPAMAGEALAGVGFRQAIWIDASRGIKASMGFAGATSRRIDVAIWYPAAPRAGSPADASQRDAAPLPGSYPLIVYSHGTNGRPDSAMHIVRELVRHGYVVVAPAYPLSSLDAFTHIRMTDTSDVVNQVADIRFVIDRALADPVVGQLIDPGAIGVAGHSLGAVTSYFAVYGMGIRDARIRAVAMTGPGDPVQAALSTPMGLAGVRHAEVAVPALFLAADKDVFARSTGGPFAAYERVAGPKAALLIHGGTHVWFRDGADWPADQRNPDCAFFDANMPGVAVPGCGERVTLIGPMRQQAITRAALLAFFDGYLKGDKAALARLRRVPGTDRAVEARFAGK